MCVKRAVVEDGNAVTRASTRSIPSRYSFSADTVSAVFSAIYGGPCDPYSGAVPSPSDAKRYAPADMTDIADNPAQTGVHDILSKHVSESTQNIIKKSRGGGGGSGVRKIKRASSRKPRKQKAKRARITKRNLLLNARPLESLRL